MNFIKYILLMVISCLMAACNSPGGIHDAMLILPESFKGDVFIVEDSQRGSDWVGGGLAIPPSGVLLVKDLSLLCSFPPQKWRAKYPRGSEIGNSKLSGHGSDISLWPIAQATDRNGVRVLYFVVGSFHEKTTLENKKLQGWTDIRSMLPKY